MFKEGKTCYCQIYHGYRPQNGVYNKDEVEKAMIKFINLLAIFKGSASIISTKWLFMQRCQFPVHNDIIKDFIWTIPWKILKFFMFNFDNSFLFTCSRNVASHFGRETTNENNRFSKPLTLKSNTYTWLEKLLMVLLWIGRYHVCMESHMKLCLQSLYRV